MHSRTCKVSELPEDLQVLVSDLIEDALGVECLERLKSHRFQIRCVPVAAFPNARMWTDYRNSAYSEAMVGQQVPPIIICGDQWLDGRNRVWAARRSGKSMMECIDLSEIGVKVRFGLIGKLKKEKLQGST